MTIANTTLILKKSGASGNTPSSLAFGELGINYADGKLYYKNASGNIVAFTAGSGGGGGGNSFATINSNSSLIIASSNNDILSIVPGNNITISTNTTSKTITINSTATGGSSSEPIGNAAFSQANLAYSLAQSAYSQSNSATSLAQSAYNAANAAGSSALVQYAANTANSATSNTIFTQGVDNTQNTNINVAITLAQAAFNKANTSNSGGGSGSSTSTFVNDLTGDGTTVSFTLANTVTSANSTLVNIDGLIQLKNSYILSNTSLIFTEAPYAGANIEVIQIGGGGGSSSGNVVIGNTSSINISNSQIYSSTVTYSNTASNQILDTYLTTAFSSTKYLVQTTNLTDIQTTEIVVMNNGNTVLLTQYANTYTLPLVSFDTVLDAPNNALSLVVTPFYANMTIDFFRTGLISRFAPVANTSSPVGDLMLQSGSEDLSSESGSQDLNV